MEEDGTNTEGCKKHRDTDESIGRSDLEPHGRFRARGIAKDRHGHSA